MEDLFDSQEMGTGGQKDCLICSAAKLGIRLRDRLWVNRERRGLLEGYLVCWQARPCGLEEGACCSLGLR